MIRTDTLTMARTSMAACVAIVVVVASTALAGPTRGGIPFGSGPAATRPLVLNHTLSKRTHFFDIQCKGVYDKSIFARLDRICEDCYNLFREPQLHSLCRKECFTTNYFKGCIDSLMLQDELEEIQSWIKQLHGAPL
ncbi:ion transport peptide-like isoform X3 [Cloeon dipterum]|uniref:ion transport peptide-like isoform X3 n=1 Tax=Cloeon dipterum TaxID=197152 RepID=UPI00322003AE